MQTQLDHTRGLPLATPDRAGFTDAGDQTSEIFVLHSKSSSPLGAAPPCAPGRDYVEERTERPIHRISAWKSGSDIGIEQDYVGPFPVSGRILAPDAATEVVLRPHGVSIG